MVNFFFKQSGFTKYPCFLCIWDSRGKSERGGTSSTLAYSSREVSISLSPKQLLNNQSILRLFAPDRTVYNKRDSNHSPPNMADFDAFEPAQIGEEDPAADFFAREQSELAGLEDFDNSNAIQNQESTFDSFGVEIPQDTGLGDFGGIGGNFSEIQAEDPLDTYSAISQHDAIRAEPEKIRIWREQQVERLQKKDNAEEKAKEEWREKAKKELDDWYKHHAEQLQKTRENNRAAEEAFIKDRDEKVPGQAWEKITRLCEFNPKNSKNTKDVSRMRSILLQLKQTPLVR